MTNATVSRKRWEVWSEVVFGKKVWFVQMEKGRADFRTKAAAEAFSTANEAFMKPLIAPAVPVPAMKELYQKQQVKAQLRKYMIGEPVITVYTTCCDRIEYGKHFKDTADMPVAYAILGARVLTDNYAGKAEDIRKAHEAYMAAPLLVEGELVKIDGVICRTQIIGEYATCIRFFEVKDAIKENNDAFSKACEVVCADTRPEIKQAAAILREAVDLYNALAGEGKRVAIVSEVK